jgi:hypothetical protein
VASPQNSAKAQIAKGLARQVGDLLLEEFQAAKARHEYSKITPLSIPEDLYNRNMLIKRRRHQVLRARRMDAVQKLKTHLGIDFPV